jgi:hypothetical protein
MWHLHLVTSTKKYLSVAGRTLTLIAGLDEYHAGKEKAKTWMTNWSPAESSDQQLIVQHIM